jgi:hypothetical protein
MCRIRYQSLSAKPSGKLAADDPFVVIKGMDRNNRLAAQDWIGLTASGSTKLSARLRAPGIAYVLLETAAGKTAPAIDEVRWMLCEDYCQSSVWSGRLPLLRDFKPIPATTRRM